MTYTKRFDEIGKDVVALAGGKGANLGELSRAGLPVPDGFVVTTRAYDAFVEAGCLKDEIVGLASGAEGPGGFETASDGSSWTATVAWSTTWTSPSQFPPTIPPQPSTR